MIETWREKENEVRAHEGERDQKIKETEAQEKGYYDEWD